MQIEIIGKRKKSRRYDNINPFNLVEISVCGNDMIYENTIID